MTVTNAGNKIHSSMSVDRFTNALMTESKYRQRTN